VVAIDYSDVTSYILLALVAIMCIFMARVIFSFTSAKNRKLHAPKIRHSLVIGLVLGFILPWYELLGLLAALISVSLFLFLALYSMLIIGKIGNVPLIAQTWLPRERLRKWFSYFAIIEGVMGIIGVVVPLALSLLPFFQMETNITPLAFASIAILADLFDLTFPSPPYRELFTQIYMYMKKCKSSKTAKGEFFVEDCHFPLIMQNSDFTVYDIREALEFLVRENMAERKIPVLPMSRVRFRILKSGLDALRLGYEEKMLYLSAEKQSVTNVLDYFDSKEILHALDSKRKIGNAQKILNKTQEKSQKIFKNNNSFIEIEWLNSTLKRIDEQKQALSQMKNKSRATIF